MDLEIGKKTYASLVVHGSTTAAATRARAVAEQMIRAMPVNVCFPTMQAGRVLAAHSRAGWYIQLINAVVGPQVVLDVELQPILPVIGIGIGIGTGIVVGRPIVVPVGTGIGTVATSAARCSRWRIVAPFSRSCRHLTLAEALRMVAASSHFCDFWQISKKNWCSMDARGRRQELWSVSWHEPQAARKARRIHFHFSHQLT